ncbi:uncharacterized protein BDV14DRAFT_168975 [Aspergillus stella-maris]|uniref:uncharacterized protein n=1 Tax=Aspergillus stella-maris TaxID=1810926 RepID=UPI003CCCD0C9
MKGRKGRDAVMALSLTFSVIMAGNMFFAWLCAAFAGFAWALLNGFLVPSRLEVRMLFQDSLPFF